MTSVDSGVETGNDSNDSSIVQHESLTSGQIGNVSSVVAATTSSQGQENEIESCTTFRIENAPVIWPLGPPVAIESFYDTYKPLFYPDEDSSPATSSSGSVEVSEFRCPLMYSALPTAVGLLKDRALRLKWSKFKSRKYCGHITWTNVQSSLNERRMRFAAVTNNTMMMKILLHKGVSPNSQDELGRTPLHLACYRGYLEMVDLLLKYGADPNKRDYMGSTPFNMATMTSERLVLPRLLYTETNVARFNDSGSNPLQIVQNKLRTLQNSKGDDMLRAKEEVQNVVPMLLTYLQEQKNAGNKVEFLSSLCSRLSLSNTSDQVQDDVKDLLDNLEALTITS